MEEALTAFDAEWKTGDRALAKTMAQSYVDAHRAALEPRFGPLNIPDLVNLVTAYRGRGDEANRILVDMWLLATHAPQAIGGEIRIGG